MPTYQGHNFVFIHAILVSLELILEFVPI